MPFTIAHTVVAFPLRKAGLVAPAVVAGSMAPDFEYFLRLAPRGRFGHTLPGIFLFTIPAALVFLWLFHRFAVGGLLQLAPRSLRDRLDASLVEFRFGGVRRFGVILLSIVVGALTHVAWDALTHPQSALVTRSPLLRTTIYVAWIRPYPLMVCKVLQHASTLLGIAILLVAALRWFRSSHPTGTHNPGLSPTTRLCLVVLLLTGAVAAAGIRTLAVERSLKQGLGVFVVTSMALLWWEVVILGACLQDRAPAR